MDGAECLIRTLSENGIEDLLHESRALPKWVRPRARPRAGCAGFCACLKACARGPRMATAASWASRRDAAPPGAGPGQRPVQFSQRAQGRTPVVSIVGEHTLQHLKYDAPLSADIEAFARTVSDHVRVARDPAGWADLGSDRGGGGPPGQVATLMIPADISWSEVAGPGAVDPAQPALFRAGEDRAGRRLTGAHAGTALLMGGTALNARGLAAAGASRRRTPARAVFADRNAPRMGRGAAASSRGWSPISRRPRLRRWRGVRHMILVETQAPVSFFGYPEMPSQLLPEGCPVSVLAARSEDGTAALEALAEECGAARGILRPDSDPPGAGRGPLTSEAIGDALAASCRKAPSSPKRWSPRDAAGAERLRSRRAVRPDAEYRRLHWAGAAGGSGRGRAPPRTARWWRSRPMAAPCTRFRRCGPWRAKTSMWSR